MRNAVEPEIKKKLSVRVDKSLNKYTDVVLFPAKVKKAKLAFKKFGLPDLATTGE